MDVKTRLCNNVPVTSMVTSCHTLGSGIAVCDVGSNNYHSGGDNTDSGSLVDVNCDNDDTTSVGIDGTTCGNPHITSRQSQNFKNSDTCKIFAVDIDGTITENGGGRIHLGALGALRRLTADGHHVIFVSGRSSVEGYLLSVFGGVTHIAVGENGGCITTGPDSHTLIGNKEQCQRAFDVIRKEIPNVKHKNVFPRMTEVVMERTFDLDAARQVVKQHEIDVVLSDSQFGYHINSPGVNKGSGFTHVAKKLSVKKSDVIAIGDSATDIPLFQVAGVSIALGNAFDDVKAAATMTVKSKAGDGVIEALDILAPSLLSPSAMRR